MANQVDLLSLYPCVFRYWNRSDVASQIGISTYTLQQYVAGKRPVGRDVHCKLALLDTETANFTASMRAQLLSCRDRSTDMEVDE